MLIKPTTQEAERYIDFAYELAMDPARSGYPTYTDKIKTKENFVQSCHQGIQSSNREILFYLENGNVAGWIQFFFLENDQYLQTEIFNIAGSIRQALGEFISYCQKNYSGYELYLGLPGENRAAIDCLTEWGWPCVERSFNDVLFFDHYELQTEKPGIVRVTKENFEDFRTLHAPIEDSMYWNCDRLLDGLDDWDIWMYYDQNQPSAAIYCTNQQVLSEIFGVDFAGDRFNSEILCVLLAKALNECKQQGRKYMVFFNDDQTQDVALRMGFHCVGEYVLFVKKV